MNMYHLLVLSVNINIIQKHGGKLVRYWLELQDSLVNTQICKCGVQERKSLFRSRHLHGQRHTQRNLLFHFRPNHFCVCGS